jgi:hypothetical protein
MKYYLLLIASIVASQTFAQTSNFIEIAVEEMIELKAQKVIIHIAVLSDDAQRNSLYYDDTEYDESIYEAEYFNEEANWMYEDMLENSPKKITKQMTAEYEERMKEQERLEIIEQQREEEFDRKWEAFKSVSLREVYAEIRKLNVGSRVIKNVQNTDYESYEYYDDYEEDSEYLDSVIEITINNQAEWDVLAAGSKDLPIEQFIADIHYGSGEEQYAKVIPNLTKKAQTQAEIMSASINRKLGKVLECTNVYPYTPSKSFLVSYTDRLQQRMRERNNGNNPFDSAKKELVQYIYKFQLL